MAALTCTSRVTINPSMTISRDVVSIPYTFAHTKSTSWSNGVGAGAVNEMFDDDRTLADGANEDLDLSGVALQNAQGTNIAFARVKEVFAEHRSGSVSMRMGAAAANAWVGPFGASTHTLELPVGGCIYLNNPTAAGWAVTNATADQLRFTNGAGGGASTYRLILLGALT